MFPDWFGFFKNESTPLANEPEEPEVPEDIVEDGWVKYQIAHESFAIIDVPEIMEMVDEEVEVQKISQKNLPDFEAVKRREAFNQAKAKTAFRNHLESVMFTDPISGKDVRTQKPSQTSNGTMVSSSTGTIRRLPSQSQRSKKTSGKSNDRKTHRLSVIQNIDD